MMMKIETEGLERRILDNMSSALLLFDSDLVLSYANPAAEMMFEVSAKHLIGKRANELFYSPIGLSDMNLHSAIDSGQPFTDRELRICLLGTQELTVDCTVIPLGDRKSKDDVLVEMQQVDRQLRISREENLLNRHQAARALVRGLAHEIKNPLGGLRGAAQLLEGELDDPALKEYTQIIIDEADRLQELVNRMLGPNRLPHNKQVNIHQVLERVTSLVQAEFGAGLTIIRDYDPSIPPLMGDADQLIQAILNIARNGARAAGESGELCFKSRVLRQFTIGNTRHRLVIQLEIQDNGEGINPELQDKVFYPLVSASQDGNGLGLSIAQSLINQHHGLIEYTSEPGQTIFTVLLPVEMNDG